MTITDDELREHLAGHGLCGCSPEITGLLDRALGAEKQAAFLSEELQLADDALYAIEAVVQGPEDRALQVQQVREVLADYFACPGDAPVG